MLELVIGAYNLMTGLMSAYVLITDLDGVMASFTESGVEYSTAILGISVAITSLGGLIMTVAGGIGMVFGPAFNINRDPLGGRFFEYLTEDPYLNGKLAAAQVRGN